MEPMLKRQAGGREGNALDLAAEEEINEHGGDAREAVRALLLRIAFLEAARDRALSLVSFGYVRGLADGTR